MASPHPLEDVIRSVLLAARAREGRLVGITVALPTGPSGAELIASLQARLEAAGLAAIEIHRVATTSTPRLVSLEFSR